MEALDLALGLGVVRGSVLLLDAEVGEQVLEGVVTTGEARGVDGTVVGMRRIVEVEGAWSPSRSRCQAIATGPPSRPPAVSSVRRATIRSRA